MLNSMSEKRINRREFLKTASLGLGAVLLQPLQQKLQLADFPVSERLGRSFAKVDIKARPDFDAQTVGNLYDDAITPWLREVVGYHPYRYKQRWVETPDGYIWASEMQQVRNLRNTPVTSLPETSLGTGMWVEVSVPYVDIALENKPASPGFRSRTEAGMPLRLYYSQILWVDQIKTGESGQVLYRVNERFGYGDLIWAPAEAFRPMTAEEVAPINPEVEDKRVEVNVEEKYQILSCYEGNREVYFCRISAGKKFDPDGTPLDSSATPKGVHTIWRKQVSSHMSGGTTGAGYDLPGIGWTSLFSGDGVAIHSTFWHNNFGGELMSHGCINARPEDAKWIFRWTNPPVVYDPGDLYSKDTSILPTKVKVVEG
jgi:lipoprotein-anchoring transpeptidase ErfK/SrfK